MNTRECVVCGEMFWPYKNTKTCSAKCSRANRQAYVRAYREAHRAEMRDYQRRYWDLIRKRRQRAKEAGGLFDA